MRNVPHHPDRPRWPLGQGQPPAKKTGILEVKDGRLRVGTVLVYLILAAAAVGFWVGFYYMVRAVFFGDQTA